jgi:hypothetical protein
MMGPSFPQCLSSIGMEGPHIQHHKFPMDSTHCFFFRFISAGSSQLDSCWNAQKKQPLESATRPLAALGCPASQRQEPDDLVIKLVFLSESSKLLW